MLAKRFKVVMVALMMGLALLGLVLLIGPVALAAGPVCTVGSGSGPDYGTIQAAVNDSGCTTINVAGGTYTENLYITRSLALMGGYNAAFTGRTPGDSIIDGDRLDSVIVITGGAAATIDGFTITGGDGSPNGGHGGGILVERATAIIRHNVISDNIASQVITEGGGGGGIYITATTSAVLIYSNTIQANVAYSVSPTSANLAKGGAGGGINVEGGADAIITGNKVISNWAVWIDLPSTSAQAFGGGIAAYQAGSLYISANEIEGNVAGSSGRMCSGGGLELFSVQVATVTNNLIRQNTGLLSGPDAQGGGFYWGTILPNQQLILNDNRIISNTAIMTLSRGATARLDPFAGGGGVAIWGGGSNDTVLMQGNYLAGNVGAMVVTDTAPITFVHVEGGGLLLREVSSVQILSNTIEKNVAVEHFHAVTSTMSDLWGGRPSGGGLYLAENESATVSNNIIRNNVTALRHTVVDVGSGTEGGGLALVNPVAITVTTNTIANNVAVMTASLSGQPGQHYHANGGGVVAQCYEQPSCQIWLMNNEILSNTAAFTITTDGNYTDTWVNSGGLGLDGSNAWLAKNRVEGNIAYRDGEEAGGGAMDASHSRVEMSQNYFANNRTTGDGLEGSPALWVWKGSLTSTNDVVAHNTGGLGIGTDDVNEPAMATVINGTYYENDRVGIEANDVASTVYVTNTIIYGHSEDGLRLNDISSTLVSNYNLLSNTHNYNGGIVAGTHDITNTDPLFVDAANDDFHLSENSPAIDKGTSAMAPSVDFEDDPRPFGVGVDIGADEFQPDTYLPLIRKS